MVIGEGTTSVLALYLLRALKAKTSDRASSWDIFLNQLTGDKEKLQESAREFAFFVADVISEKLC